MRRLVAPALLAVACLAPAQAQDADRILEVLEEAVEEARARGLDRTDLASLDADGRRVAAQIARALERRRVTVNFADTPFTECVAFLQDITGLNIVLSAQALERVAGAERDVSLRLRDIKLRNCLELLLKQADRDLRYAVKNGVLTIALEEELRERLVLRFYEVSDLVSPHPDFPGPRIGLDGAEWDD